MSQKSSLQCGMRSDFHVLALNIRSIWGEYCALAPKARNFLGTYFLIFEKNIYKFVYIFWRICKFVYGSLARIPGAIWGSAQASHITRGDPCLPAETRGEWSIAPAKTYQRHRDHVRPPWRPLRPLRHSISLGVPEADYRQIQTRPKPDLCY